MDLKFILLMTGIFLFTLGYVNQNKYNCNIIPSLDKMQDQDLSKLFYKKDILLKRDPDNKIYDYKISGTNYEKYESDEYRKAQSLGRGIEGDDFNFSGDRKGYGQ